VKWEVQSEDSMAKLKYKKIFIDHFFKNTIRCQKRKFTAEEGLAKN
jgi:hypothetical protein